MVDVWHAGFVSHSQLGVNKSDTHGEVSKDVEFVQGNVDLGLFRPSRR